MTQSKYATIADRDGELSLFLGKKDPQFSLVKMSDGDGDEMSMERLEFERRALIHLPERMSGEEFKDFTNERQIGAVLDDCLGLERDQ